MIAQKFAIYLLVTFFYSLQFIPIPSYAIENTCILIHGCFLQTEEWENIMFGTEANLGRVPIGIEEAINKHASLIFWGSGGSEKEGVIESQYIFNQAIGPHLHILAHHMQKEPEDLRSYLDKISFLDFNAHNTLEEVSLAIDECLLRGIQELILISSPTHIARCLQEACKLKEQRHLKMRIYARASDTCFAHSTAKDVTIFEPAHRSDTPNVPIHQTVKGIFQFLKDHDKAANFNQALAQLIAQYKENNQACNHSCKER